MNRRRQELYDRIRATSRAEVIREEMVRLGFWGKDEDGPAAITGEWLAKREALTKEINSLVRRQRKFENRQAMLREMRRRRMAEAKLRRTETKERREQERKERAAAWKEKQAHDITYLGPGVSAGLHGKQIPNAEKLREFGLPQLAILKEVATCLGLSMSELRFLAYSRDVSKTTHYRRFYMPKKSGGQRLISAPMPRLKHAQYGILEKILSQVPVHEAAHGFAPGRSILTNAERHVGQDLIINIDLKDFFPSVTYKRVKGLFRAFGYTERVATVIGLICTEPEVEEVELDGQRYFVHSSERRLPQGAPTSPAITNILCYRLDKRMAGVAEKLGFNYTRYADDMTFSASGESAKTFKKLLWRVRSIVTDEGFEIHPDKTRLMRKGSQQEVTGLTVNEKVAVPRREIRNFRSLLFQIEKDGIEGKKWRGSDRNLLSVIRGYAYFIRMVDPIKGTLFVEQVEKILEQEGWHHVIRHPRKKPNQSKGSTASTKGSGSSGLLQKILKKLIFWK